MQELGNNINEAIPQYDEAFVGGYSQCESQCFFWLRAIFDSGEVSLIFDEYGVGLHAPSL
jgi:hypothetical protein